MKIYDSEGNTSLISDGSKISAIYQDRTIDLWAYVVEEEGYADTLVGWETDKKNFLRVTNIWNLYAEVIDNKGILIWEYHISSEPQYYFAFEFSLNDGWIHSNIVEEPSGKYGSYKLGSAEYPEWEYLEKPPDNSKGYFISPEVYPKYIQIGGSVDGTNFLRFFDQIINPDPLSDLEALKYIASNSDLISAFGINTSAAIAHYQNHGKAEGRSLNNFDEWQYLASNGDLITTFGSDITSATQHYVSNGYAEGRNLDAFDEWQYLASHSDLITTFGSDTTAAIHHYVSNGYSEGRLSDNFDEWSYLASNTDLITAFGSDITAATQHYISNGYAEGRSKDSFDEWGYLASNNDLMNAFGSNTTEAIKHYISHGLSEGRVTNSFNVDSYLNNYVDINSAFGHDHDSAKRHFIEHGFAEGRVF